MIQTIAIFVLVVFISTVILYFLTIDASLDTSYILSLLFILVLHTSLIISILLKKGNK